MLGRSDVGGVSTNEPQSYRQAMAQSDVQKWPLLVEWHAGYVGTCGEMTKNYPS